MVLLHQTPPDSLNIPVIAIENKDGAAMLIHHLIEVHGRRRIVFCAGRRAMKTRSGVSAAIRKPLNLMTSSSIRVW
jgi:DNA-binding LacI/PurR family transcriptional regulator